MIRTYRELLKLNTFQERLDYLKLSSKVGDSTFGYDRYLNQRLYHSTEWKTIRNSVIIRDGGCDLGIPGCEIVERIIVHHINPITVDDIVHGIDLVFDPNNLICVSHDTHQVIHFGDKRKTPSLLVERRPGDTILW